MKLLRTPAEKEQIRKLILENPTFINVFNKDWTKNVIDDLSYKLYGKIPRNFLINISGLIGTPTGIFKSTLGLQIALTLDNTFTLQNRVAFTINSLIDKVRDNSEFYMTDYQLYKFKDEYEGEYEIHKLKKPIYNFQNELCNNLVLLRKMIFFLDEQTKSLKTGSLVRLKNLIDTCRERQLCFITCGVDSYEMNFSTYDLQRIQESHDNYLPKKTVQYAVYDRERDIYYGYFKWNITPLTDLNWNNFWKKYSILKTEFQRNVMQQQINSMDYEDYAMEIIESEDFDKCFVETKTGERLLISLLRSLIIKKFPDLTNQERDTILAEVRIQYGTE